MERTPAKGARRAPSKEQCETPTRSSDLDGGRLSRLKRGLAPLMHQHGERTPAGGPPAARRETSVVVRAGSDLQVAPQNHGVVVDMDEQLMSTEPPAVGEPSPAAASQRQVQEEVSGSDDTPVEAASNEEAREQPPEPESPQNQARPLLRLSPRKHARPAILSPPRRLLPATTQEAPPPPPPQTAPDTQVSAPHRLAPSEPEGLRSPPRRPLPEMFSEPLSLVVRRSPRRPQPSRTLVPGSPRRLLSTAAGDWDSDENTPVRQSPRREEARRRYHALLTGSPVRNPKKRWFIQCLKDQMTGRLSLSPAKTPVSGAAAAAPASGLHVPTITQRRLNLDAVDDPPPRPSVIRAGASRLAGAMALVELSNTRFWATERPTPGGEL